MPDWKDVAEEIPVIGQVISILGGLFSGDGGQGEAVAQQGALNKELLNMFRTRENMELPFRENLMQNLAQRSQKQFPEFKLPAQPSTFNPFANMRTSMPLGAPPASAGGARGPQLPRGMMDFLAKQQGTLSREGGA